MYFFLAQDLFSAPLTPDEDEFIETMPTTFSQAQELLKNGEIIDAKTVLGISLPRNIYSKSPHNGLLTGGACPDKTFPNFSNRSYPKGQWSAVLRCIISIFFIERFLPET
jgi:hypothetical protein